MMTQKIEQIWDAMSTTREDIVMFRRQIKDSQQYLAEYNRELKREIMKAGLDEALTVNYNKLAKIIR